MAKPETAPSIEPHSSPTNATRSGVRSAETPNTGTCETTPIWISTTSNERASGHQGRRRFARHSPAPVAAS